MFDRAVVTAQCTRHCNYADFPQLLIRWCFHAPASIIRLALADFLYVNQLFIRLFPPEKIRLFHAEATPMSPRAEGPRWASRTGPGPSMTGFPPLYRSLAPVFPLQICMKAWKHARPRYSFEKLDVLPRDYPTLWAAVWRKKSLWASYRNVTCKCVITCYHWLD